MLRILRMSKDDFGNSQKEARKETQRVGDGLRDWKAEVQAIRSDGIARVEGIQSSFRRALEAGWEQKEAELIKDLEKYKVPESPSVSYRNPPPFLHMNTKVTRGYLAATRSVAASRHRRQAYEQSCYRICELANTVCQ